MIIEGRYYLYSYYSILDKGVLVISITDFYKSVKNGSDDYVREQLYGFNSGKFAGLPIEMLSQIAYIIGDEMDIRHLW